MTPAETCHWKGWGVGTVLTNDLLTIEITAIGKERVVARLADHDQREAFWDVSVGVWKEVFPLDAKPFILLRPNGFDRERLPSDHWSRLPLEMWKWEPRPGTEQRPAAYDEETIAAYDEVTRVRRTAAVGHMEAMQARRTRPENEWDPIADEKDPGAPWND